MIASSTDAERQLALHFEVSGESGGLEGVAVGVPMRGWFVVTVRPVSRHHAKLTIVDHHGDRAHLHA